VDIHLHLMALRPLQTRDGSGFGAHAHCLEAVSKPVWHELSCHDSRKERIMTRKTKRVLTNDQWDRIAPHIPEHPPSPKGGRPRADDRACLEGILWLVRTGSR
jgi:hypothetical protein